MRLPARPAPRAGLSLLEVLAALSIFLMSFVAIGRLVTVATDHSLEVQMQSQATQMAHSKLNEVVAGSLPLSSQTGNIDEDPDWQWSIDADQNSDVSGLWTVKVRVWRQLDNHEVESTLAQMVLDPSTRGSMFDQVVVTGSTDTASSSSTSNSSSNSSASQQPAQSAGAAATPAKGTMPGKGNTPTTPGKGNTPTTPGKGNTPTTPGKGNTPTTPGKGNTPTTPGKGNTPTTPGKGNTPTTPSKGG